MMRILIIGAVLGCAVFGVTQGVVSHDVVHEDGATAQVLATFENGSFFQLNVSRETPDATGNFQTFLFYDVFTSSPDGSFTETFARGEIPSGTFQGDSIAHLVLNVDTSQAPSFTTTSCTFTFVPQFIETCAPGAVGVIQIDWAQSHNSTTHSVVVQSQVFNQIRADTNQNADTASAVVTGAFLGTPINAGGQTGINHSSTLELFRF